MKLSKKDKQGVAIISVVSILLISLLFVYVDKSTEQGLIDKETLCIRGKAVTSHTILLLDKTDAVNKRQRTSIIEIVEDTRNRLNSGDKISLFLLEGSPKAMPTAKISLCNPGQGNNVNPFFKNPKKIQKKYNDKFKVPLDEILSSMLIAGEADSSPIVETIENLFSRKDFDQTVPERRLVIISDLLQNSRRFSHYKKDKTYNQLNHDSEVFIYNLEEFINTKVSVYYINRNIKKTTQNILHLEFWESVLVNAGMIPEIHPLPSHHLPKRKRTVIENRATFDKRNGEPSNRRIPNLIADASIKPSKRLAAPSPSPKSGDTYIYENLNHSNNKFNNSVSLVIDLIYNKKFFVTKRNVKTGYTRSVTYTNEWNAVSSKNRKGQGSNYYPPIKYFDFPLEEGKTWEEETFEDTGNKFGNRKHKIKGEVGTWEWIEVPAGKFETIKVILESQVIDVDSGKIILSGKDVSWYSPKINKSVKSELSSNDFKTGKNHKNTILLMKYNSQ